MQKVIIELEFFIGQMVYLKTDIEQRKRIVTGINIRPLNAITYTLALGDGDEMNHYGIEISTERDAVMSTFN